MRATSPSHVQVVVSGKFITLLLIALSLLGGGYYWYSQEQEAQKRFRTPPYFVNRGATVIRPCAHCLNLNDLKPQSGWEIGVPTEILPTETRWFLAVEDPPAPVTVAGVLMLPVYPALRDDPFFGFDQTSVLLVPYQNLQRMPWMEHPRPPPPLPQVQPSDPVPIPTQTVSPPELGSAFLGDWENEDQNTRWVTRFSVADTDDKLLIHAWGKCVPVDCDWAEAEATMTGSVLSVVWDQNFVIQQWVLSLEGDDRLLVSSHDHYTDSRGDRDISGAFIRHTEGQQ